MRLALFDRPLFTCGLVLITHLSIATSEGAPLAKASPFGTWLTQAGDAKVQVRRCGSNICGKIVWLKDPIDKATGKPQRDDKNSDPLRRARPIIGLQLFVNMGPATATSWSGRIYNADDGQTYASTVTPLDDRRLEVRGCVGAMCGAEIWIRAGR